jgi:hypothetical protein
MTPPPELKSRVDLWFGLSIASVLFGCCLLGIFAILSAHGARESLARGDFATAESKLGTAKVLTIINFVLFGLGLISRIVLTVIGETL